MTQEGRLLTSAEVARLYGKHLRKIQRLAASGDLPYVRKLEGANGSYLFDPQVVAVVMGRQADRELMDRLREQEAEKKAATKAKVIRMQRGAAR